MKSNTVWLLFPAAGLFLAACGSKVVVQPTATAPAPSAYVQTPAAPSQVVVTTVPTMPALPEDTIRGFSPGANYTWVAGYYNWQGDRYQWVPGAWVQTPASTSVWVSGRWQPTAGGYTWVPGHWQ